MCKKYNCEKCNFITNNHTNYENHLLTKKHNNQQTIECNFECKICNKKYKCNSGLWRHNQKCIEVKVEPIKSEQSVNEIPLMEKMFKEINDLKNMIISLIMFSLISLIIFSLISLIIFSLISLNIFSLISLNIFSIRGISFTLCSDFIGSTLTSIHF